MKRKMAFKRLSIFLLKEMVFIKKKVLIIDDALFMRESLKSMLSKCADIEVVGEAPNGAIGVELYKELKPDVVTMDITMPEMDGIEALKRIKTLDPAARVIMISAMGQEGMVKQAILSGAKTFIVKPFTEVYLLNTITKVLTI